MYRNVVTIHPKLVIDFGKGVYIKDDVAYALSRLEIRLLEKLVANKGRIVSNDQLIKFLWFTTDYYTKNELHVLISRLRKKIEKDPKNPQHLITVRGRGYILK